MVLTRRFEPAPGHRQGMPQQCLDATPPPPARRGDVENSHQVTATRGAHDFLSRRPAYSGPVVATNFPPCIGLAPTHPRHGGGQLQRRRTCTGPFELLMQSVVRWLGRRGGGAFAFCAALVKWLLFASLPRPMWCAGGGTEAALGECAVLEARHHVCGDERAEDGVPRLHLAASAGGLALPFARFAARSPHQGQGAHARLCCSCPARPWMSVCLLLRAGWGAGNAGNLLFVVYSSFKNRALFAFRVPFVHVRGDRIGGGAFHVRHGCLGAGLSRRERRGGGHTAESTCAY